MRLAIWTGVAAAALLAGCSPPGEAAKVDPAPRVVAASDIEHGRYLVKIGGCNDCHTPGFPQSGGATPEAQWMTGNPVGYAGPWGVTYASNLRLTAQNLNEQDFVEMLNTRRASPPMPWHAVRAMHDADKRALYRYLRSLGPAGAPAPAALPPGMTPTTPYENMMPVMPKAVG